MPYKQSHKSLKLLILTALIVLGGNVFAQKGKKKYGTTRILFVFDGSQSMYARWESDSKINIARNLLNTMIDSLEQIPVKNFELALRVYGHQSPVPPQDCNDTRLEVPFSPNNYGRIRHKLKQISPRGTTPIARSLEKSAGDFPKDENARNIIILITDGVEACDEDPCAVSRRLQKSGIVLKPFVIGVGANMDLEDEFTCVGNYFDASDEMTFKKVLGIVISQALDNTTAQVNLIDSYQNASETNVNMAFYNHVSGNHKENIVHTMNVFGLPDTIDLDPLVTYDIIVHTIPPVEKKNVTVIPGTHNVIGINAPQGTLRLNAPRRSENLQCIIRQAGKSQTLHVQQFNSVEEYLVGKYDLEILTLPRYIEKGVSVGQSTETKITIPPAGLVNIYSPSIGIGSVYYFNDNKWIWVCNLAANKSQEVIHLQPGNYRAVYRPKSSQSYLYTVDKQFTVVPGGSVLVKLSK
ncbi:MAG: Ca-activated chloride channel family protein [Candidatus Azotimanducaceae bacterium]|jgi:Ca-activated chloride channel family protein